MHYPCFPTHQSQSISSTNTTVKRRTAALYVESTLEPHEYGQHSLSTFTSGGPDTPTGEESHIDLSAELLLRKRPRTVMLFPIARVIQCVNEDVPTIAPYPGTLLGRLLGADEETEESLSFILDALAPETAEGPLSLLEMSSGTYKGLEEDEGVGHLRGTRRSSCATHGCVCPFHWS